MFITVELTISHKQPFNAKVLEAVFDIFKKAILESSEYVFERHQEEWKALTGENLYDRKSIIEKTLNDSIWIEQVSEGSSKFKYVIILLASSTPIENTGEFMLEAIEEIIKNTDAYENFIENSSQLLDTQLDKFCNSVESSFSEYNAIEKHKVRKAKDRHFASFFCSLTEGSELKPINEIKWQSPKPKD